MLLAILLPVFMRNQYFLGVITLSCIWAISVYGMNVLLGYTGQLSLAQAGFFGVGAYTVGILTVNYETSFWAALLGALVLTVALGYVVGLFALRTRNEYFAIFTLGVGIVIFYVIEKWEGVTGGRLGLIGVPYPAPLQELPHLYYLVLAFLALTIYIVASVARSLVGRGFMAIRNSEELAAAVGINVGRNKQLAFVISAVFAGLAGALYAPYIGFLGPAIASVPITFNMLLYLLVGGLGSLSGPLVGSLIVASLTQLFQQFQEYQLVIFGPVLVLLVIFFPRGLAGLWRSLGLRSNGAMEETRGSAEIQVEAVPGADSWPEPANEGAQKLLRAENLSISFGGLKAVDGVDLEVERGKIVAIIGPNGAGKSTFFNVVSGFHRPDAGRVILDGEDVTGLPPHRVVEVGMARTFQMPTLFEEATVLDNVIIGHRVRTRSNALDAVLRTPRIRREEKECRMEAMEALSFAGVDHLAGRPVASISQEARRRVSVALALATKPKIVLLDEPAAGINEEETEGLSDLIRKMVRHGLTVCLVEHKMSMVMSLADKVVVLHHGEKIAEGTPQEIRSDRKVIEAYLGEELSA